MQISAKVMFILEKENCCKLLHFSFSGEVVLFVKKIISTIFSGNTNVCAFFRSQPFIQHLSNASTQYPLTEVGIAGRA